MSVDFGARLLKQNLIEFKYSFLRIMSKFAASGFFFSSNVKASMFGSLSHRRLIVRL